MTDYSNPGPTEHERELEATVSKLEEAVSLLTQENARHRARIFTERRAIGEVVEDLTVSVGEIYEAELYECQVCHRVSTDKAHHEYCKLMPLFYALADADA